MVASVVGGLTSSLLGYGLNQAFGPDMPQPYIVGNVQTPGLNLYNQGGQVSLQRTPFLQNQFGIYQDLLRKQASALTGLMKEVEPGFSALRESRMAELESARQSSISNLQNNLARRRISGSSFANDALLQTNAEFAQLSDQVLAETTLMELDMYNQLLTQRFNTLIAGVEASINQTNFESQLGVGFASGMQNTMASIFNTSAQLAAQNATGLGAFFSPYIYGAGDFMGGLFGGGFNTGNTAFDSTDFR